MPKPTNPYSRLVSWAKAGVPRTDEIREKISATMKGKPKTPEAIKNHTKSLSFYWRITDPNGQQFIIQNLNEFCRITGLNSWAMKGLANNYRKTHHGYRCERLGKLPKKKDEQKD